MSDDSKNRAALIIGIDHYSDRNELFGCVNDAMSLNRVLERHENKEKNFTCEVLTSLKGGRPVSASAIRSSIDQLFSKDLECAVFYFSGHCHFDEKLRKSFFVPQDLSAGEKGIDFEYLMDRANTAYPKIKSTTILIDGCHAGSIGENSNAFMHDTVPSAIGTGVSILAASDRNEYSYEDGMRGGFFSRVIINALEGSAADLRGKVTPAALYSHTDQILCAWDDQRPIYKANVKSFITLRKCKEKLPLDTLLSLPALFPTPDHIFKLDPSFEPDRENIPDNLKHIPVNKNNAATFKKMQDCNRFGLVVPVDAEHMYYAAIESKACKLTELGKHYRLLAELDRL